MMRPPRRRPGRLRLTVAEIVERYEAGQSMLDIALDAKTSASTIKNRLLAAGVTLRRRGGQPGPCNSYLLGRRKP
jgi:hypothetical protein